MTCKPCRVTYQNVRYKIDGAGNVAIVGCGESDDLPKRAAAGMRAVETASRGLLPAYGVIGPGCGILCQNHVGDVRDL